jgi:hypothetical protein
MAIRTAGDTGVPVIGTGRVAAVHKPWWKHAHGHDQRQPPAVMMQPWLRRGRADIAAAASSGGSGAAGDSHKASFVNRGTGLRR